jgi:hypothetical protein
MYYCVDDEEEYNLNVTEKLINKAIRLKSVYQDTYYRR